MKEMKLCFYGTQSDILLCGIARFSRGNKNKLRTFQPQKWKKIKNSQSQTKFTGSYIKKRMYISKKEKFEKVLNSKKVDWRNLLEQFLHIAKANFAILFFIILKRKTAIFKICNFFSQTCFLRSGNQVFAYHAYIFISLISRFIPI